MDVLRGKSPLTGNAASNDRPLGMFGMSMPLNVGDEKVAASLSQRAMFNSEKSGMRSDLRFNESSILIDKSGPKFGIKSLSIEKDRAFG